MSISSDDLRQMGYELENGKAVKVKPAKPKKPHKYNVADKKKRVWNGKTYDSKAEMERAEQLHKQMQEGEIIELIEQPSLWLGVRENVYRPDFFVITAEGEAYYEDVKGVETSAFRKNKKLWARYARLPLRVIKRRKKGFRVVEVIEGQPAQQDKP